LAGCNPTQSNQHNPTQPTNPQTNQASTNQASTNQPTSTKHSAKHKLKANRQQQTHNYKYQAANKPTNPTNQYFYTGHLHAIT
jgi:hypothetical protein